MLEWKMIVTSVIPVILAVIPWVMRVHAKLEVVASQLARVAEQLEMSAAMSHELNSRTADHAARLNAHDIRFMYLNERIGKME